jgi:hypothetical protein
MPGIGTSGRKPGIVVCLTALLLVASAGPTRAAVTIGQTAPSGEACQPSIDRLQPTVASGTGYVVPASVAAGTITSWSTEARAGLGRMLMMKVYRPLGGDTYLVVGHDGPHALNPSTLNTFPTNVAVRAGDVLGSSTPAAANLPGCSFGAPGDSYLQRSGNLAVGESAAFPNATPDVRLNVSAVVNPSNSFTLGKVKHNRKKGTATVAVTVPNPGSLRLSGKDLKKASASGAVVAKTVTAPGKVKLKITATGRKRRGLNQRGRVKVKPKITYTPTGGDPASRSRKLSLRKN